MNNVVCYCPIGKLNGGLKRVIKDILKKDFNK